MPVENSETDLKKERGCPFLGLSDDPGTALAYPSSSNHCHHARPVAPVDRAYQATYCLTSKFSTCSVYLKNELLPLPKEIGSGRRIQRKNIHWVRVFTIVGIVLIIAALIFLVNGIVAGKNENQRRNLAAQTLASASLTMSSAQIQATHTPTPAPTPIETPTPTMPLPVPTSIPIHQLEVPIGENPSFVIHRIQAGENFIRFLEVYNASREAILAVNYGMEMEPSLWAGAILVIPIGVSDATGLPAFTTYIVNEQNLTIEALAENEGATVELLEQYNGLPAGYIFSEGEWVLIPH